MDHHQGISRSYLRPHEITIIPMQNQSNLPEISVDEILFMHYQKGSAGGFRTHLYDLYWKADRQNRFKLQTAFPELWVLEKYSTDPSYWGDLVSRWKQYCDPSPIDNPEIP